MIDTAAVLVPSDSQQIKIEIIVKGIQETFKTQILDTITLICEHFMKKEISEVELDVERIAEDLPLIIEKKKSRKMRDNKNLS